MSKAQENGGHPCGIFQEFKLATTFGTTSSPALKEKNETIKDLTRLRLEIERHDQENGQRSRQQLDGKHLTKAEERVRQAILELSKRESYLQWFNMSEATFESGPQAVLQICIVLKVGNVSSYQLAAIVLSIIRLTMTTVQLYLTMPTKATKLSGKQLADVLLLTLLSVVVIPLRLLTWAIIGVYLEWLTWLVILASMAFQLMWLWRFVSMSREKDIAMILTNVFWPCITFNEYTNSFAVSSVISTVVVWTGLTICTFAITPEMDSYGLPPILTCFPVSDTTLLATSGRRCYYDATSSRILPTNCTSSIWPVINGNDNLRDYRTICQDGEGSRSVLVQWYYGLSVGLLILSIGIYVILQKFHVDPIKRLKFTRTWNDAYLTKRRDAEWILEEPNKCHTDHRRFYSILLTALEDNIVTLVKQMIECRLPFPSAEETRDNMQRLQLFHESRKLKETLLHSLARMTTKEAVHFMLSHYGRLCKDVVTQANQALPENTEEEEANALLNGNGHQPINNPTKKIIDFVTCKNKHQRTVFHIAARFANKEVFEYIVDLLDWILNNAQEHNQLNVTIREVLKIMDFDRCNILQDAILSESPAMMTLVLESLRKSHGCLDTVAKLKKEMDFTQQATKSKGENALHTVCRVGNRDLLISLFEYHTEHCKKLFELLKDHQGQPEVDVEQLVLGLFTKANHATKPKNQITIRETPLHAVVKRGYPDCLNAFVDYYERLCQNVLQHQNPNAQDLELRKLEKTLALLETPVSGSSQTIFHLSASCWNSKDILREATKLVKSRAKRVIKLRNPNLSRRARASELKAYMKRLLDLQDLDHNTVTSIKALRKSSRKKIQG